MPDPKPQIYTLVLNDKPILVFATEDDAEAADYPQQEWLRADLAEMQTEDGTLPWNGTDPLTVRPAAADEQSKWQSTFDEAVKEGELDQEEELDHTIYLVEFKDE